MAKLQTISGPTRGKEYELKDICILGRSPHCQVYIGDLTVSRQHARVTKSPQGWSIEDLGSGNGTFINETRVTKQLLTTGDEIRISNSTFRFISDEETGQKWVNMVTVLAGNEPGLINSVTEARISLAPLSEDRHEADLRADLNKAHRMLETIYAVTNAISSILDSQKLFNIILDYLFNVFPDAKQGFIMLLDTGNQLVPAAIRQRRGVSSSAGLVVSQTVVAKVLNEGKCVLTTGNPRESWTGTSKMCAPLAAQGKTLGILLIEGREEGQPFCQEDMDLLNGISLQAGGAILNAHMHQLLLRQQRLEQDMQFARQVQQSFMPLEPPEVPGFLFNRVYNPVFDVGGDFYDFIPLPQHRFGVLIGDVSGKGVSAALLMARLTSEIRFFALSEQNPAIVLSRANNSLLKTGQDNMFATVLYLVLDAPHRCITISNAGHIPPLMRMGKNKSIVELDEATSLALGVMPDAFFDEYTLPMELGDSVLLCTDGVIEAKNPRQEEYGLSRLHHALSTAPVDALLETVLKDLQRYSAGTSQYDDITLVGFTCTG